MSSPGVPTNFLALLFALTPEQHHHLSTCVSMNSKPQTQRLIIANPTLQRSSDLLTIPDELLLKIVHYCGLVHISPFIATCRAASMFVDDRLMAVLFDLELQTR
jgi:hypothetical protein